MERLPDDYHERIKKVRGHLGLTQTRLAELLGVSFATVNRWENRQSRPSNLARVQINGLVTQDAKGVTARPLAVIGSAGGTPPVGGSPRGLRGVGAAATGCPAGQPERPGQAAGGSGVASAGRLGLGRRARGAVSSQRTPIPRRNRDRLRRPKGESPSQLGWQRAVPCGECRTLPGSLLAGAPLGTRRARPIGTRRARPITADPHRYPVRC